MNKNKTKKQHSMGLRNQVGKRQRISMPVGEIWDHQHTSDLWKAFASVLRVTAHPIIVQNTSSLFFFLLNI